MKEIEKIKWFEKNKPLVTDNTVKKYQDKVGFQLPMLYAYILKNIANGGLFNSLSFNLFLGSSIISSLLGINTEDNDYCLLYNYQNPSEYFPEDILAFSETANGDKICFDYRFDSKTNNPPIVYWDHECEKEESLSFIAKDFESFLELLNFTEEESKVKELNNKELENLIYILRNNLFNSKEDKERKIDLFEYNVFYPNARDLIFNNNLSIEEVLNKSLSYQLTPEELKKRDEGNVWRILQNILIMYPHNKCGNATDQQISELENQIGIRIDKSFKYLLQNFEYSVIADLIIFTINNKEERRKLIYANNFFKKELNYPNIEDWFIIAHDGDNSPIGILPNGKICFCDKYKQYKQFKIANNFEEFLYKLLNDNIFNDLEEYT